MLLRNPVYIGKIVVPALDNEPKQIIEGLHQGLISEALFNKVQSVLNKKTNRSKNKVSERTELPFRGFLSCSSCGKIMTGSGSKSQNGNRYFYYHCRESCKVRYSAVEINKKLESLIEQVSFPEEQIELFQKILAEKIASQSLQSKQDETTLNTKLAKLKGQESNLDESFLSNIINGEKYNRLSERIQLQMIEVKNELSNLKNDHSSVKSQIRKKVVELQALSETYLKSSIYKKRVIISSIFPEKIEIHEGRCRTKKVNSAIHHILLKANEMKGKKKDKSEINRICPV